MTTIGIILASGAVGFVLGVVFMFNPGGFWWTD